LYQFQADDYLLNKYLIPFSCYFKKKIILVFDNADYNSYHKNSFDLGSIMVIYADQRWQTADDIIIKIIKESVDPHGLILVTSDRELLEIAHHYGCAMIKTEDFLNMLDQLEDDLIIEEEKVLSEQQIKLINDELWQLWQDK
jgi:predicted RNA-binding protein with PIN domain